MRAEGHPNLYFSPNVIRMVKENGKDRAIKVDVLDEKSIKNFAENNILKDLGINKSQTFKFILQII